MPTGCLRQVFFSLQNTLYTFLYLDSRILDPDPCVFCNPDRGRIGISGAAQGDSGVYCTL